MWKHVGWKKRAPLSLLTGRQSSNRWKCENSTANLGSHDNFWHQTLAVHVNGNLKLSNAWYKTSECWHLECQPSIAGLEESYWLVREKSADGRKQYDLLICRGTFHSCMTAHCTILSNDIHKILTIFVCATVDGNARPSEIDMIEVRWFRVEPLLLLPYTAWDTFCTKQSYCMCKCCTVGTPVGSGHCSSMIFYDQQ